MFCRDIKDKIPFTITINVDKVADEFVTSYPVRFIYDNGNEKTYIYKINNGENRFVSAGDESQKIKKVIFNPDYDILEQ